MYWYWVYFSLFILFEIVLFLFPAFPPELWMRLLVLFIYVVGHVLGVQTKYKHFKYSILETKNISSIPTIPGRASEAIP